MDSWPPTSSRPTRMSERQEAERWAGYRAALSGLSIPELMEHLAQINAAQEAQARRSLERTISSSPSLSDYQRSLDQLNPSSTGMEPPPWLMDRGAQPSRSRPPDPGAVDLLARSQRLGPKLASRLLLASARAQRGREG